MYVYITVYDNIVLQPCRPIDPPTQAKCFLLSCPKLPPKILPQVASQDFAPVASQYFDLYRFLRCTTD